MRVPYDANNSGAVTAVDALCVLRNIANFGVSAACPSDALLDTNGRDNVTSVDALCVLRKVAGFGANAACEDEPPIGIEPPE